MHLVHRRKLVQRSLFGKLPLAGLFYLSAGPTVALIKSDQNGRASTWDTTTGKLSFVTLTRNVPVMKIPDFLLKSL